MKQGFSLIELLVVVAIIGVLAGAGIVGYQSYLTGVKADTYESQLRQIARAIEAAELAADNNLQSPDDDCEEGDAFAACIAALAATMNNPYDQEPFDSTDFRTATGDLRLCGANASPASTVNAQQVTFVQDVSGLTMGGMTDDIDMQACDEAADDAGDQVTINLN